MKENFFDPASLALDDDEVVLEDISTSPSPTSILELVTTNSNAEEIDQEHRIQNDFRDPLEDLALVQQGVSDPTPQIIEQEESSAPSIQLLLNPSTPPPAIHTKKNLEPPSTAHLDNLIAMDLDLNHEQRAGLDAMKLRAELGVEMFQLVMVPGPFQDLADRIVEIICRSANAESATLFEIDYKTNNFFFRSVFGTTMDSVRTARLPLDYGLIGDVNRTMQPANVNDLTADPRFQKTLSHFLKNNVHNCMAAPIVIDGKCFGVVEVFNQKNGRGFNEAEFENIQLGVTMAAKVLELRFLLARVTGG